MTRKILITNDDGITSDGIIRLARVAQKFGEVYVVAPETQRSAASHSITLRTHIDVYPHAFPVEGVHAYAITGTPADCVRLGVLNIVPGKPDIVFSGINYGYNVGTDLQYSATAGAAFEAVFQGIPAIAFSEGTQEDHSVTDENIEQIMAELVDRPYMLGTIWNVNFPSCPASGCKGILWDAKVSTNCLFVDRYEEEALEDGGVRYRVNGIYHEKAEEGTDLRAMLDDYIAVGMAKNIG